MRKLITFTIILISILLILSGCSNHAFKVVATTVNPTPKQKGLLAIACNNQFKQTPQLIKGELRIDTLTINSSDTVTMYKFDTVQVTITNTVKAIVNHYQTDTIREVNSAREYLLEGQIRDKDNVISNLQNKSKQDDEIKSSLRKKVIFLLGILIMLIIGYIARVVYKLKK